MTRAWPELAGRPLAPYGQGLDNTAYRLAPRAGEPALVVRFPRRRIAIPWLEHEARLLPGLAPRLPAPIPVPLRRGEPSADYPAPFSAYAELPGEVGCADLELTLGSPELARELGAFLAALHAAPLDPAADSPRDTLRRSEVSHRVELTRTRCATLDGAGEAELAQLGRRALDEALAGLPPDAERVAASAAALVHGDLYARHVLVAGGRLAGVIDWGDAHRGDPALDLAFAWGLTPPARAAFALAYGPVEPGTWARARFRAACHGLAVAGFGVHVGDAALRALGARCLRALVEHPQAPARN